MKNHRVKEFIRNPRKALFILAGPLLVGFLVQTLYNIVDTAFVGRLGPEAIAALTFGFPLFFIFMGINGGVGAGTNSRISRYLGAHEKGKAENAALHGLVLSMLLSVVMFVLAMIFLKPLFSLFGAEGIVADLALDYMFIIVFGIFFMFPAFVFNSIFAAQGDTKTAMLVQVISLGTNIILDPIFIYVLGLGVKGAAIATLISFALSLCIYLYFRKTRSYLKLRFRSFRYDPRMMKDIIRVGFPAGLMMLLMSVVLIAFNRIMAYFGTLHVAAVGISFRTESMIILPIVALSLALLTLSGMFKGAKRFDLVKSITYYAIRVAVIFTVVAGAILAIAPWLVIRVFTDEPDLLVICTNYLRVIVISIPFSAVSLTLSRSLQGMGHGLPGLVVNGVRMVIVSIPLAAVFVFVFHFSYIWVAIAMVIGSIASSAVALTFFRYHIKKSAVSPQHL